MIWPTPPQDRLRPLADEGMVERLDRRLEFVIAEMVARLPAEHRRPVLALGMAAAVIGLVPHTAHDPDGNLWLALPSVDGRPWMLIPGYELGLWWIDGELTYCLDPIHDHDLIDITEC